MPWSYRTTLRLECDVCHAEREAACEPEVEEVAKVEGWQFLTTGLPMTAEQRARFHECYCPACAPDGPLRVNA